MKDLGSKYVDSLKNLEEAKRLEKEGINVDALKKSIKQKQSKKPIVK